MSFVWWTEKMDARLLELRLGGSPARIIADQISSEFGVELSKNSIIGRSCRLRENNPDIFPKLKNSPKRTENPKRRPRGVNVLRRVERTHREPKPMPAPALTAEQIPMEQRRTLMSLRPGECRWPFGDPGTEGFFFCGAPQMPHACFEYCPAHFHEAIKHEELKNLEWLAA